MCYLNAVRYFTILRVEIKKSPAYVGLLTNWRLLLVGYYLEDDVDAVGGGACLSYFTGLPT
jgi:hypothetical protein